MSKPEINEREMLALLKILESTAYSFVWGREVLDAIRDAIKESVGWKIRAMKGLKEILELRTEVQRLKKEIRVEEVPEKGKGGHQ